MPKYKSTLDITTNFNRENIDKSFVVDRKTYEEFVKACELQKREPDQILRNCVYNYARCTDIIRREGRG